MREIATHRTRRAPHHTVCVVEELPASVLFRNSDTVSMPRDMFDEAYVAIRERPFIPRQELEEIVEAIDDGAILGVDGIADALKAVLAKVTT